MALKLKKMYNSHFGNKFVIFKIHPNTELMIIMKNTTLKVVAVLIFTAIVSCNFEKNKNWNDMVWNDEFNYTGLPDSAKWEYDIEGNEWGWGNNEAQYYTRQRKENAWVENGLLYITARHENYEDHNFTSARLVTRNNGDWLYGRIEVRAKLPTGRGTWPAIWMLSTDWEYGGWPESGEIDIMENVGYNPDSVFAAVHTLSYNHTKRTQKSKGMVLPDCDEEFHVYATEWDRNEINTYVDDNHIFSFSNEGTGYKEWPFDKRFHLLLNVAVGGTWGGAEGIDTTIFPQAIEVDYVRVYQK